MTYRLVMHEDFDKEWQQLPIAIQTQLKKKIKKLL